MRIKRINEDFEGKEIDEKSITHSNVSDYRGLPPFGYEFSSRKLTQKARGFLNGYWTMTANLNEKNQEISEDYKPGESISEFDRKWKYKYMSGQARFLGELKPFIRRKR